MFHHLQGKQWKTDSYFKMLGRTLLHNNSRECYLSACAKEGSDIVTISMSGDPCDICARYENRLLSISGKTKGLTTLQQAMSEGLFHPNCTHRMIAVPEVVAQEYYDKDGKEKEDQYLTSKKDESNKTTSYNFVDFTNEPQMIIQEPEINLKRLNTTNGRKQWDIVPDEVKKILGHEMVKGIPKHFMLKTDDKQHGFVLTDGAGRVTFFNVAHNSKHAALTAVHETGHIVDKLFMTKKQKDELLGIIKSSEEYKRLLDYKENLSITKNKGKRIKKQLETLEEVLKDDELITRGYVQYVMKNKKGILLEQFQNDCILYGNEKYFFTVEANLYSCFTQIIEELGL